MKRFWMELELLCLEIATSPHIFMGLVALQIGLFIAGLIFQSSMLASCCNFVLCLLLLVRGVVLYRGSTMRDFLFWFCWSAVTISWFWYIFATPPNAINWLDAGCRWYLLLSEYNDDDDSGTGIKRRNKLREKLQSERQAVFQTF